jgi:hypothetical protein
MTVSQQPPSGVYGPPQQQHTFNNCNKRNGGGQGSGRGFPQEPTMTFGGTGGGQQKALCPPTPYKHWEDCNYCHTHGGDVDDTHTSATCGKPGPTNNPNASCTNIMGGSVAGMHKTTLPSACGCTPPNHCPKQQQLLQPPPLITYYPPGGMVWQQSTPPAQCGVMPPANGAYHQQTTMVMLVYQPSQGMMMNVNQYPRSAGNVPMLQMGQQTMAAPMMMNYYAPNQQPSQQPGLILTSRGG